jgi:uncharacterized cofD-like protein
MKKIVTIGGGSGQFVLLSGLRDIPDIDITAIVSMADSGGSTGRLRDELGVLPPGDILKCVLALSRNRDNARELLQRRFKGNGRLGGHSVGNMLLTMLSQYANDFPGAVTAMCEILDSKGAVLPITTDRATLVAELEDGTRLFGEAAIDVPKEGRRSKIKSTFLVPHHSDHIKVYEPAIDAILEADHILIGPGDLYTSVIPNFLVPKVKEAILKTRAKLVYVVNIMTKFGETDYFSGKDFVENLEESIGRVMDVCVFNSASPGEEILKQYKKQKSRLVVYDEPGEIWDSRIILKDDLLSGGGDIARHDPDKLAVLVGKIINRNNGNVEKYKIYESANLKKNDSRI